MGDLICLRCSEPGGEAHACAEVGGISTPPTAPRVIAGKDAVVTLTNADGTRMEFPLKDGGFTWTAVGDDRVRPKHCGLAGAIEFPSVTYDLKPHAFRCVIRPFRVPAWEIHRNNRNPPARILLQWARDTGRHTRKGGGWLRRAWRRHALEARRDLVGEMARDGVAGLAEALAPLAGAFAEATGAFADAMTEAASAWRDFGQALPSMGPDFTRSDLDSAPSTSTLERPPYPTEPPVTRTDDPELAVALRAIGADVRPAFVRIEVADGRPGCDYSVSVTAPGPLPAEEESDG